MKTLSAWLAIGVTFLGCSSSSGSDSSAAASTCGKVAACGGNLVGTWKVVAGCAGAGLGNVMSAACPNETVQGASVTASGTATFNADLTYTVSLAESVSETLVVPLSCLSTNGASATCDTLTTTLNAAFQRLTDGGASTTTCAVSGANCSCAINLSGMSVDETGTYSLSGDTLMTNVGGVASSGNYCVQGNTLHIISLSKGTGAMGMAASDIVATKQ